jgi:hypothetical protein
MTNLKDATKIVHPWSSDALLAKAQRYAEEMRSYSPGDWQFGLCPRLFWSSSRGQRWQTSAPFFWPNLLIGTTSTLLLAERQRRRNSFPDPLM